MLFLFSPKASLSGRLDRGPPGRASLPDDGHTMLITPFGLFFTASTFSWVRSPRALSTPRSTPRKPAMGSSWCWRGWGGSPELLMPRARAPVPGLQRSLGVPGLRGPRGRLPRVAWDSEETHLRRRQPGPLPARSPAPPLARPPRRAGTPHLRRLALRLARPRRGWEGSGGVGGQRPGLHRLRGRGGKRELGDPARLRRQVGRAGWGSPRRDQLCAPPRPSPPAVGEPGPASPPPGRVPAIQAPEPPRGPRRPAQDLKTAPVRTHFPLNARVCSVVTCHPCVTPGDLPPKPINPGTQATTLVQVLQLSCPKAPQNSSDLVNVVFSASSATVASDPLPKGRGNAQRSHCVDRINGHHDGY